MKVAEIDPNVVLFSGSGRLQGDEEMTENKRPLNVAGVHLRDPRRIAAPTVRLGNLFSALTMTAEVIAAKNVRIEGLREGGLLSLLAMPNVAADDRAVVHHRAGDQAGDPQFPAMMTVETVQEAAVRDGHRSGDRSAAAVAAEPAVQQSDPAGALLRVVLRSARREASAGTWGNNACPFLRL
jgi:hypothetical protein